jgi:hypothetical protein
LQEVKAARIGGYKNLIPNKNGSLEIRYSAIDYKAKNLIRDYIGYNKTWHAKENSSTGIYFEKTKYADNKTAALQMLAELQTEADNFKIEGMKAKVFAAGYCVWGRYYLVLSVNPLMIEGNPLTIAASLTGQTEAELHQGLQDRKQEQENRLNEHRKAQADRDAKKAAGNESLQHLKKEKLQAIPNAIYIAATVLNSAEIGYRFFKVEKMGTFGRVIISSYLSKTQEIEPEKFDEYRKGKQMKPAEITQETYRFK